MMFTTTGIGYMAHSPGIHHQESGKHFDYGTIDARFDVKEEQNC